VVTGLGVVGLLVTWLAGRSGAASVVGVDPDPERRRIASDLGATGTAPAVDDAPVLDADVCVDASGAPSALEALVARAGSHARIVIASWYGDRAATLALGGAFHPNRVSLRSSQVGSIAARRRERWDAARRWMLVSDLLEHDELDRLVGEPVGLSEAPRVYA